MNKGFKKFMLTSASAAALLAAYPSLAPAGEALGLDTPAITAEAATNARGFIEGVMELPNVSDIVRLNSREFETARKEAQTVRSAYNRLSNSDKRNANVVKWEGYLTQKENALGNNFIAAVGALPSASAISELEGSALGNTERAIEDAKSLYEALPANAKANAQVSKWKGYLDQKEAALPADAAEAFVNAVLRLPNLTQIAEMDTDGITATQEAARSARNLYNGLTAEDKADADVVRWEGYLSQKEEPVGLKLIGEVHALPSVAQINELDGEELAAATEAAEVARDSYEALSDAAKEDPQVVKWEGYLSDKEDAIEARLAGVDEDTELEEAIAAAEAALADLPSLEDVTLADVDAIEQARELVEAVKALDAEAVVEGEEVIAELEDKIAELVAEEEAAEELAEAKEAKVEEINAVTLSEEETSGKTEESIVAANEKLEELKDAALAEVEAAETVEVVQAVEVDTTEALELLEELVVVLVSAIDANTIEVTLSDETVHEVTLEEALEPNVETEVTFTIDDVEYTETVTYEVDDVMAPVITVTGVKSPVAFGDEVEMPTVTVFDEVNENLEATLVITIKDEDDVVVDAIDSRVPGTYTLTYTAEDYAGNKATATATVIVEGPEVLTSVDPVTTSSSKVVVTADEKDLTADNFIVTFLDDEAEAGSDPVELTIVSVTNIEDAEGNPTTDYVIEYEDLNGKSGKLTVNEYTPVEVNYTDAGLTEAVEAVNTAAGTTEDSTKVNATYEALEAAVLNYADILDDELKEEYQEEIATSQTQNYTRLTEAIERVNAKAAEDKAKEDAETLKTVNELTSANSAEQVRTALTNAGATLLADGSISGADYFDAIEGTTFESLDEVVATIDAFNLATVEEAVAAAEAAVEGINFDTAEATTANGKADGLVDAYAAEAAYNLPTTKEAVEADEDADTTAYDFKVRLVEVQDAISLEGARQDVLADEKIESVKANLETLAKIENSGLDADTIKDDVANDYKQTIGYEAQYKIEIGRLADTATVAHIQNAVNLANERAEAAAEQAAVDAVFAAESIVVTEAEGDTPRTVTAGDHLITNLTALEAAEKVQDSKVVENNKNAYAVALDKLDAKTATRADILALVDTVNAQEAADDVAAVFTTFTVAPNADDVLEATFYADTTVETPETDDGVAFKAALDVLVTAEGYTAERIADYALEINKLDPATATKADIEAAIETVDAQAEAQALVDAVNIATTKEDMGNALVAVDYAPYINLGSTRRLEVVDLLLGNNEAADTEVEYETVAEIETALDEVIAEYNTLIANVNSATTITEARAALQAIVDSNATVTNLVDPVTNAQAEELLATFDGETPAVYTTISDIDVAITPQRNE